MTSNTLLAARPAKEDARVKHERALMDEIRKENENPFQEIGDVITARWSHVYNNYLYCSGVLLVGLCFWSVYPSYVRFRHAHIMRYRRTQLLLRRWLFATPHMPKWNKKYLQEVVIPPIAQREKLSPDHLFGSHTPVAQGHGATAPAATVAPSAVQPHSPNEGKTSEMSLHDSAVAALSAADRDVSFNRTDSLLAIQTLHGQASQKSTFSKGEARQSERQLNKALVAINKVYFNSEGNGFFCANHLCRDEQQLRTDIEAAVKQSRSSVVLKETNDTVKSIPPGYEVWWLSADEAKRTRFCKFWIGGLLFARLLQDLLDMPEMPDFVQ